MLNLKDLSDAFFAKDFEVKSRERFVRNKLETVIILK
jgi:hypothetical protein